MSDDRGSPLKRKKQNVLSFDIDDEDREYYYRQHGKPQIRVPRLRPSKALTWSLIGAVVLLTILFFASGRREKSVDYSRFAYITYAADTNSLCHSLLLFEALKRLGSKADRLLHHPYQWSASGSDRNGQLLARLRDKYKVRLVPTQLLGPDGEVGPGDGHSDATWDTSVTKLSAFQLTTYKRIMHLDNDLTLLQNLDDLFLLPPAPVAMPRAYWTPVPPHTDKGAQPWPLTSLLMVLQPSTKDHRYMMEVLKIWREDKQYGQTEKYDTDLLNFRFGSSALVLPQRPYALLTSEFRRENHSAYLGEPASMARWDPDTALKEAKLVHFSDWPLPKPWTMWSGEALTDVQPACKEMLGGECRERRIWKDLYDDFRRRRKEHCSLLSEPAPRWADVKMSAGIKPGEKPVPQAVRT